jgi:hypothetical protein
MQGDATPTSKSVWNSIIKQKTDREVGVTQLAFFCATAAKRLIPARLNKNSIHIQVISIKSNRRWPWVNSNCKVSVNIPVTVENRRVNQTGHWGKSKRVKERKQRKQSNGQIYLAP